MIELEGLDKFILPTRFIPHYNVIIAAIHRALMSRGLDKSKYPDFVEAIYLGLRPKMREKVREWRDNEEMKIYEEEWKRTGNKFEATIRRYDKLLEVIIDILDKEGMFVPKPGIRVWGERKDVE